MKSLAKSIPEGATNEKCTCRRPFAESSRRANRPFATSGDNLSASSLIDFLQLSRSHRTRGAPLPGNVFLFILFLFSDKIFVINGLDEERARSLPGERASDRFHPPPSHPKNTPPVFTTFENTPPDKRLFFFLSPVPAIAAPNYHPVSSRNFADGHFYIRALFASLKFQLGSTAN